MYIYEYDEWPQFSFDMQEMTGLLERCHIAQGRLLSKMELLGLSEKEDKILTTITSDVIKSSEIEGFLLNKEQVRSSIARRLGLKTEKLVNADRNVDAVVEMMLDATQHYDQPLTQERLFGWHACLFPSGYSGMYKIEVAQYRTSPMQVVSGALGQETVHYEAPPAEKVPAEMDAFLAWLKHPTGDSLVQAAIAHLWFVTIHPFDDGNGRIARTISDMLLCKSDQTALRFYSMSNQILLDRNNYYAVLERTQHGSLDITAWMDWFLNCLLKAITESYEQTTAVLKKYQFLQSVTGLSLNERQTLMLKKLLDAEWFGVLNSSKWAKITKCSTDTALRDITDLVKKGILQKEPTAGGRSTNYVIVEK